MGKRMPVTTYLTEDGYARLKAVADRQERSISYMAGAAIGAFVVQAEELEAIVQARALDPGQVDLEEMIAAKNRDPARLAPPTLAALYTHYKSHTLSDSSVAGANEKPVAKVTSSVKSIPVKKGKRK